MELSNNELNEISHDHDGKGDGLRSIIFDRCLGFVGDKTKKLTIEILGQMQEEFSEVK